MYWIPNITTIIIAWIVQCLILSGLIFLHEFKGLEKYQKHWFLTGFRVSFYIPFMVFSLIFMDTNIKLILLVINGNGNIAIHLASIVLTSILAVELVIFIVISELNLKKLIIFGMVTGFFLFLFEFYLNVVNLNEINILGSNYSVMVFALGAPIIIGMLTSLILTLIIFFLKKANKSASVLIKPFWSFKEQLKPKIGLKFQALFWILLTTELLLNLQGLSLLLWITYFI